MNLKKLREARNLTQQDIADFLGVSRTSYTKYENGIHDPSIEDLTKLADFFNVTIDYLIGLTDELLELPYFQALRRYCKICGINFQPIKDYFANSPDTSTRLLQGEPIKLPDRQALEKVLGMKLESAIFLGSSLCKTQDEYSELYEQYLEATPDKQRELFSTHFNQLNHSGQQKVISYIDDLVASGQYPKSRSQPSRKLG